MRRHEFSPAQWELIADLMPLASSRGGGRWRDHRQVLNGLFWKLVTCRCVSVPVNSVVEHLCNVKVLLEFN